MSVQLRGAYYFVFFNYQLILFLASCLTLAFCCTESNSKSSLDPLAQTDSFLIHMPPASTSSDQSRGFSALVLLTFWAGLVKAVLWVYRMFGRIPGLSSPEPVESPTTVTTRNVSRHARCLLETKSFLSEKHCICGFLCLFSVF